jgi:hypothetical protein
LALFVKIFVFCFLFSKQKIVANNPNTKTLLKTQKQFSPLCHIKTLFQNKNKKHPPKGINSRAIVFHAQHCIALHHRGFLKQDLHNNERMIYFTSMSLVFGILILDRNFLQTSI